MQAVMTVQQPGAEARDRLRLLFDAVVELDGARQVLKATHDQEVLAAGRTGLKLHSAAATALALAGGLAVDAGSVVVDPVGTWDHPIARANAYAQEHVFDHDHAFAEHLY